MRYISMFSGIEAVSCAWGFLGWEPVAFAEVAPFACAVLAHHYPSVPNVGDMTAVDWSRYRGRVDVVVGGPPCQAFSVAGLRRSLDDDRGNLSLQYVRAIHAVEPLWAVTENVPGWLSTKDNAFGSFLAGLVGADAPLVPARGQRWTDAGVVIGPRRSAAWRILDAQFFGVPQRRRRVFIVSSLRDGPNPAAVLFECESLCGDLAPSREARQDVAGCLGGGAGSRGRAPDADRMTFVPALAGSVTSREGLRQDATTETFVVKGAAIGRQPENGPQYGEVLDDGTCYTLNCTEVHADGVNLPPIAHTLRSEGSDASEDGTGRGVPLVPIAFDWQASCGNDQSWGGKGRQFIVRKPGLAGACSANRVDAIAFDTTQITSDKNYSHPRPGDPCHPLAETAHPPAVAVQEAQTGVGEYGGITRGDAPGTQPSGTFLRDGVAVRRLLPVECEALQGLPRDWTLVPYRGKPAADGPRYRAIGNSMAVPCMAWLGKRIAAVERTKEDRP